MNHVRQSGDSDRGVTRRRWIGSPRQATVKIARVCLSALAGVVVYGAIHNEVALAKSCQIGDARLNEGSGLAASIKHPGIVYTHNDEAGPIFAVDAATCRVVGTLDVPGLRGDPDPEAITIDRTTGKVWYGDIGNGHPTQPDSMTSKKKIIKHPGWPARIAVFDEPNKLRGTMQVKSVDITFPDGDKNAEGLLVNPKTGEGYIIGKYAWSPVYKLPHPLKSGQAKAVKNANGNRVGIPEWVTDATFTNDGKWILVRYRTATDPAPDTVWVYDATWKRVGSIKVPDVPQGESITADIDGSGFYIGSEGTNSPLVHVALPSQYIDFTTAGEAIPEAISETECTNRDRKVLTDGVKKYCAKRRMTMRKAPECVDPKPGYAKFTYIVDPAGDFCGYW